MEKPWKVVLAFVGVFVAGAIFGGLLSLRVGRAVLQERERKQGSLAIVAPSPKAGGTSAQPTTSTPPSTQPAVQPPQQAKAAAFAGPQAQTAQLLKRFTERLDLTAEQRERVTPLIQRATADFRRQQQTHFRDDTIVLQRLQEDIRKELTPEQIAKLEQMEEKQRKILEQRQRDEQAAAQNAKTKQERRQNAPPRQVQAQPVPTVAPAPTPPPGEKP